MADYWKSNDRKYCDFCKCWIADNKPSVQFHESGRRHKLNVVKRISEISRRSAKDDRAKEKFDLEFKKMEDAAMKAYMKDCSGESFSKNIDAINGTDTLITPNYNSIEETGTIENSSTRKFFKHTVDPILKGLPDDIDEDEYSRTKIKNEKQNLSRAVDVKNNSLWCEARTDDGHKYYWNVKTYESIWESPKEGHMTLAEYNQINKILEKKREDNLKQESLKFSQNADEYVAKHKREENYKKYNNRVKIVSNPDDGVDQQSEYNRDPEILKTEAQPYGRWETVVEKEEKVLNLQLPIYENNLHHEILRSSSTDTKILLPKKEFKERTIQLPKDDVTESCVFKKRKLSAINKRNGRQRLDED